MLFCVYGASGFFSRSVSFLYILLPFFFSFYLFKLKFLEKENDSTGLAILIDIFTLDHFSWYVSDLSYY